MGALGVGVGEEEVRTVGATTEGLGRMDSWPHTPLGTPSMEDREWVHVSVPGKDVCAETEGKAEDKSEDKSEVVQLSISTHSNHCKYSISLKHSQKVHRE